MTLAFVFAAMTALITITYARDSQSSSTSAVEASANGQVQSAYSSFFANYRSELERHPPPFNPLPDCCVCGSCTPNCQCLLQPFESSQPNSATFASLRPTGEATSTVTPPSFSAVPQTMRNSAKAYTTISKPVTAGGDTKTAAVVGSGKAAKDVTLDFYALALSGDHPAAIPLIVSTGNSKAVTIIGYANTTVRANSISHSLLSALELTNAIKDGRTVKLDILAGVNDRFLPGLEFNVEADAQKEDGPWDPEVVLGMDFLNRAQALVLSSEFQGKGAAAREGLSVVVQKVFEDGAEERVSKSEL